MFVSPLFCIAAAECRIRTLPPPPFSPSLSPVRFVSLLPVLLSLNLAAADDPPPSAHHLQCITGRATQGMGPWPLPVLWALLVSQPSAFTRAPYFVVILGTSSLVVIPLQLRLLHL